MFSLAILKGKIPPKKVVKRKKKTPFNNKLIHDKLSPKIADSGKQFEEYKDLLERVSVRIDSWHEEIVNKRQGKFERDEDFIDLMPSPTKFQSDRSSSSEDYSDTKDSTKPRSPCLEV